MKGFLKVIGVVMVFVLMFQTVGVNFANAAEFNSEGTISEYKDIPEFNTVISPDETAEPQFLPQAAIWLGGLIIGSYILVGIDVIIEYETGYSAKYWIEKGYGNVEGKIKDFVKKWGNVIKDVIVNANGTVTWKCKQTPCPLPTSFNAE